MLGYNPIMHSFTSSQFFDAVDKLETRQLHPYDFVCSDAFPISCRTIVRATGKFSFLVLYTFIVLPWKQYLIPWRYKFPLLVFTLLYYLFYKMQIAAIYPLVGPIGYGPNGLPGGWGVVLPWGISVGPQFKLAHTPWPFAYNLVFYLTVLKSYSRTSLRTDSIASWL